MNNDFNTVYNEAYILYQNRDYQQALVLCNNLIQADANNYLVWNLLGQIFFQQLDYETAIQCLKKSIEIKPDFIESYYWLGNVFFSLELYNESISVLEEALYIDNSHSVLYYNISAAYLQLKKYDQSENYAKKTIEIDPKNEEGYICLSKIYRQRKDQKKALEYLLKALEINNKNPESHVDLSTLYFINKNYLSAFKHYEHRKYLEGKKHNYDFMPFKKYQGQNLKNKSLLIYHEQGFGDNIQFVRFLNKIECSKITYGIQNSLNKLFSYNFPNIDFQPEIRSNDKFDYMVPLMSIPHFLKLNVIDSTSYLQVNKDDVTKLRKDLEPKKFNIGLVWTGSKTGVFYKEKILQLKNLKQLFKDKNRKFYSLQIADFEELESFSEIHNLGKSFQDFYDTAVAIEAMDLIISIDTAVAHLAGAMGKNCFVLNNSSQFDWRWEVNENNESLWYNSIKVYKYEDDVKKIINRLNYDISLIISQKH